MLTKKEASHWIPRRVFSALVLNEKRPLLRSSKKRFLLQGIFFYTKVFFELSSSLTFIILSFCLTTKPLFMFLSCSEGRFGLSWQASPATAKTIEKRRRWQPNKNGVNRDERKHGSAGKTDRKE